MGPANQAWLANPTLFLGWISILIPGNKWWWCLRVGICLTALAMSASFLFAKTAVISEALVPSEIISHGFSYWLWLASMTAAFIAAFLKDPSPAKLR